MEITPVAHIENDFKSKFAVPRQSGLSRIKSKIIFEKEFADRNAIREIEGFSHLWLIWGFSENEYDCKSLTVRPPRLGGNKRVGVFASRSPFRPNGLGLSSVRLEGVEYSGASPVLIVSGADLIDGTPIYDIKPYIKFSDCRADAVSGFAESNGFPLLDVEIKDEHLKIIPESKRSTLFEILKNDPRPAYHSDNKREYGFRFSDFEIKFTVNNNKLEVTDIYAVN